MKKMKKRKTTTTGFNGNEKEKEKESEKEKEINYFSSGKSLQRCDAIAERQRNALSFASNSDCTNDARRRFHARLFLQTH